MDVLNLLSAIEKHGGTVIGYAFFIIIVYQVWVLLKKGILVFFESVAFSVKEFFDAQTETLREALEVGKDTKRNTEDIIGQLNTISEKIEGLGNGRCKKEYKEISNKLTELLDKLK